MTEERWDEYNSLLLLALSCMMKEPLRWMMDKSESNPGGLSLALLGAFQTTLNNEPLGGISADKIRGVLAYLVVESDRPQRRSFLAEMFWPDRPSSVARGNLKQAIAILRKVLGDRDASNPYLLVSRNSIQFNASSHYWLDLSKFTEALDASMNHRHRQLESCEKCAESLLRAVELYRGDFLAEFYLPESREFEEWAAIRREALRRQMANALRLLTTHHEQRSELEAARKHARRLVNHEPWNEGNHRILMRMLAITGKRSEALRQFKTCRRIIREEFDTAPADETLILYQKIRNGQIEALKATPVAAQAEQDEKMVRRGPQWLRYSALGVGAIVLIAVGAFGLQSLGIMDEASPGEMATSTPSQALPQDMISPTDPATSDELPDVNPTPSLICGEDAFDGNLQTPDPLFVRQEGFYAGWISLDPCTIVLPDSTTKAFATPLVLVVEDLSWVQIEGLAMHAGTANAWGCWYSRDQLEFVEEDARQDLCMKQAGGQFAVLLRVSSEGFEELGTTETIICP